MRERNEALSPQLEQSARQLEQAQKELAGLKTSVEALRLEKELLEKRVQVMASAPTPADPRLAEAEKKLAEARQAVTATESQVTALQRERDILTKIRQDLEQKLAAAQTDAARLRELDMEKIKKLERDLLEASAAAQERDVKQQALASEHKVLGERLAAMISERDQEMNRKGKDSRKLKEVEKELEKVQKKLNDTSKELYAVRSRNARADDLTAQLANLRARVDAYEMKRVALTPEELALLRAPPTRTPTPPKPVNLSPPVKNLVAEAQTDVNAGRLKEAEQKYQEVVRQSDKEVYSYHQLAAVQLDQNKFAEADVTIGKGLAIEPNNAGLLYQRGIVRYEQGKLDEALALLSRSVKADGTKAEVFNYLGFVMGKQGMLNEAETAFRKTLQLEPSFVSAHMSLAWLYANQKPPFIELARWHYNRALAGGETKNPELEKKFNPAP
jgi:Flp pilus assembly protein TadD